MTTGGRAEGDREGEGCQGDGWLTGDARTWFGFGRKVFETPINLG
jgi:hypothetical protein